VTDGDSAGLARMFEAAHARHEDGALADAKRLYQAVLAVDPAHRESLTYLGVIALQEGRIADGMGLLEGVIARHPDVAAAHAHLATGHQARRQFAAAVASYERALALDPDDAATHYGLGAALLAMRRFEDAAACYRRAIALDPDYIEAHAHLGVALQELGRHEEACACYVQALALDPDYPEAEFGLGTALGLLKRKEEALAHFRRAVALKPDFVKARLALARLLRLLQRSDEALPHLEHALAIHPDGAEQHFDLALVLGDLRRYDDAIAQYEKVIAMAPEHAHAHQNLGEVLRQLGRLSEADRMTERAIALDPNNAQAFFNLTQGKKTRAGDPHLAMLEDLAGRADALTEEARVLVHFALGKALADIGEHQRSFDELLRGNALKRHQLAYNEADALARLERLRRGFSPELMRRSRGQGDPSTLPVFILGMPRSGSTLIEQILAGHPKVHAAGELPDWQNAMTTIGSGERGAAGSTLGSRRLRALATTYVAGLAALAPTAERVTDKLPGNFQTLGLIHLALPNARIIHTRRDPVDTCLSCFSILFANELQPYTYDLGELGRVYRAYHALMGYWRSVLPEGAMLEVDYEDVVNDLEGQARRIVAFCGLDWDGACLAFHTVERAVRTASIVQVRQPIYRSSVGRWRPRDELLRPLLDALGPLAAPADDGRSRN
jgi:tetratricopeptide (TPR) repeat protein